MTAIAVLFALVSAPIFAIQAFAYLTTDSGNDQEDVLDVTNLGVYINALDVCEGTVYAGIDNKSVLYSSEDGVSWSEVYNFTDAGAPWERAIFMIEHDDDNRLYVSINTMNTVWRSEDAGESWDVLLEYPYSVGYSGTSGDAMAWVDGFDYYDDTIYLGRYGQNETGYLSPVYYSDDDGENWSNYTLLARHIHAVKVGADGVLYAGYGDNIAGTPPYTHGLAYLDTGVLVNYTAYPALSYMQPTAIVRTDTSTVFASDSAQRGFAMTIDSDSHAHMTTYWDIGANYYKGQCYHGDYVDNVVYLSFENKYSTGYGQVMASPDDGYTWIRLYNFGLNQGQSCIKGEDGYPYLFIYRDGGSALRMNNVGQSEIYRLQKPLSTNTPSSTFDETFILGNNKTTVIPLNRDGLQDATVQFLGHTTTELWVNPDMEYWNATEAPSNYYWTNTGSKGAIYKDETGGIFGPKAAVINYSDLTVTDVIRLGGSSASKISCTPGEWMQLTFAVKGITGNTTGQVYLYWYNAAVSNFLNEAIGTWGAENGIWENVSIVFRTPKTDDPAYSDNAYSFFFKFQVIRHLFGNWSEEGNFTMDGVYLYRLEDASSTLDGVHGKYNIPLNTTSPRIQLSDGWHNYTGNYADETVIGSATFDYLGGTLEIETANAAGAVAVRITGTRAISTMGLDVVLSGDVFSFETVPSAESHVVTVWGTAYLSSNYTYNYTLKNGARAIWPELDLQCIGADIEFRWIAYSDTLISWNITANETVSIYGTILGLDSEYGYRVSLDGDPIAVGVGPSVYFSASGDGLYTVELWTTREVSAMIVLTVNMVGLGVVVSIVGSFVMPIAEDIRKNRPVKMNKLFPSFIRTVVFIIIGLLMWGVLHAIAIG